MQRKQKNLLIELAVLIYLLFGSIFLFWNGSHGKFEHLHGRYQLSDTWEIFAAIHALGALFFAVRIFIKVNIIYKIVMISMGFALLAFVSYEGKEQYPDSIFQARHQIDRYLACISKEGLSSIEISEEDVDKALATIKEDPSVSCSVMMKHIEVKRTRGMIIVYNNFYKKEGIKQIAYNIIKLKQCSGSDKIWKKSLYYFTYFQMILPDEGERLKNSKYLTEAMDEKSNVGVKCEDARKYLENLIKKIDTHYIAPSSEILEEIDREIFESESNIL